MNKNKDKNIALLVDEQLEQVNAGATLFGIDDRRRFDEDDIFKFKSGGITASCVDPIDYKGAIAGRKVEQMQSGHKRKNTVHRPAHSVNLDGAFVIGGCNPGHHINLA